MKRLMIIASVAFILMVYSARAQQIPNSNQYLVNRYLISPSFAGFDGNARIFIGYRHDWSGFEDAPKTSLISAYLPVSDKVWLGGQIIADNAGIYNNIYAHFSYTYQLQIGFDHMIYFGMWASMFQNKINLDNAIVSNPDDPLLAGLSELTGFSVNAGTSIVYKWREGYIGVSVPYLFKNKDAYALNDVKNVVELYTQIVGHASYKFRLNYNIEIEPIVLYRWIQNYDSQFDVSLMVYYRENYWIGGTYRDIGKAGATVGSHLTRDLTLNYTFEFVTKSYIAQPSSTHEFTLGFTLPAGNDKHKNRWRRSINNRNRR